MVFVNFLLKHKLRKHDHWWDLPRSFENGKYETNHPSSIALHLAASCSQTSPHRCHGIKIMSPPYLPVKPTQQVLVSPSNLRGDQVLTLSIIAVGMTKRFYRVCTILHMSCLCTIFCTWRSNPSILRWLTLAFHIFARDSVMLSFCFVLLDLFSLFLVVSHDDQTDVHKLFPQL